MFPLATGPTAQSASATGAEAPRSNRRAPEATSPGARLTFDDGIFELNVRSPLARAGALLEAEAEFVLVVEEPLIVLVYRLGTAAGWSAAELEWHPTARSSCNGAVEAPGSDRRALLTVKLDGAAGRSAAVTRNLTLSLDFTRALDAAIRERARMIFDPHAYRRARVALERRCPTPEAMLGRAVARTIGNP